MDFTGIQWLDIANRSLAMISSNMLSTLEEGTPEASYISVLLPQSIEEVYAAVTMDDVSRYAELPKLADGSQNGSGYRYAYKVPESCSSIREVILDGSTSVWQRIGNAILTDSTSVSVRYIPLPANPSDMPYYARELVSLLLASRLAGPVAHNEALVNILRQQYESQLARAYSFAPQSRSQEGYVNTVLWTEDR